MKRYKNQSGGGEVTLPWNWKPREDQLPLWEYLEEGGKRALMIAHRKWGKDTVGLNWSAYASFQRKGSIWHMLPHYSEARKAIWEPIDPQTGMTRIESTFPDSIIQTKRDTDMFIRFVNGSTWQMVGSDNYDSLVGAPPVGIVFSEYSLCDPKAWAYMRPIIEQNKGWALFLYTPRGDNHGLRLLELARSRKDWFSRIVKASESPVFTKEQLEKEKQELIDEWGTEAGLSFYMQEYECSFSGFRIGMYYGVQMEEAEEEGRICEVPWEQQLPVFTAWDLGMDDSMSIWCFQVAGSQFRFIDYIENTGKNFAFYANELLEERPYVYGDHFLPHDVRVREGGTGDEPGRAKTRKQKLESLGIKPIQVVERARDSVAVLAGIFSVRELLPFCVFDKIKCARGIEGLKNYSAKYDDDKKKLMNTPINNWTCHPADSMRTFAVGWRETSIAPGRNPMEIMERYYGSLL